MLTLDLMQVQVNGRMVDVNTTDVSQQSGSRGARSGKVIGGTTALGAIIGAIAGGGKGAAIGAGAGATLCGKRTNSRPCRDHVNSSEFRVRKERIRGVEQVSDV